MNNFSPLDTVKFLQDLAHNNQKVWFDEHRDRYKIIRENLKQFIIDIHYEMQVVDPTLRNMDPAKSLFRINRDTRFSHNKSPYKVHMGAKFSATGAKKGITGYGFGLSADGHLYLMGGIQGIPTDQLNLLRDDLIASDGNMETIFMNKQFMESFELTDLGGGKLKNTPRGYPKDAPHADILKLKAWWAIQHTLITPKNNDAKTLGRLVVEQLSLLQPMVTAMNDILLRQEP
jgi:uncharacterized protein (TIGR02453 family)